MKTFYRTLLIVIVGNFFFNIMPAAAQDVAVGTVVIDESTLRKAIIQVLKDDPKLVYDAYTAYQRQSSELREQQQFEYGFKNPLAIAIRKGNPVKGPANASITIISLMDFQCPYCARAVGTLTELMEKYPGKLRLVYKNNPLRNHTKAIDAAKAALAADRQGKFWEFRDLLYADMSKLNDEGYVKLAGDLGLDLQKFNTDRNSDDVAAIIAADQQEAEKNNLTSVPYFLVNGVRVKGAKDVDYFSRVIDRLLVQQGEVPQKNNGTQP